MVKTQCAIHEKEIDKLRERSHSNANEIGKLTILHEENQKNIKDLVQGMKNIPALETKVAVVSDKVDRMDKIQMAVLGFSFSALVGIVINIYFQFK